MEGKRERERKNKKRRKGDVRNECGGRHNKVEGRRRRKKRTTST